MIKKKQNLLMNNLSKILKIIISICLFFMAYKYYDYYAKKEYLNNIKDCYTDFYNSLYYYSLNTVSTKGHLENEENIKKYISNFKCLFQKNNQYSLKVDYQTNVIHLSNYLTTQTENKNSYIIDLTQTLNNENYEFSSSFTFKKYLLGESFKINFFNDQFNFECIEIDSRNHFITKNGNRILLDKEYDNRLNNLLSENNLKKVTQDFKDPLVIIYNGITVNIMCETKYNLDDTLKQRLNLSLQSKFPDCSYIRFTVIPDSVL